MLRDLRNKLSTLQGLQRVSSRVESSASHGEQLLLAQAYRTALAAGSPLPPLPATEFRNYSQNGEDGILLFLCSVLGLQSGASVEIGASDGIECNTANLLLHHGFHGLLVDGNPELIERGRSFYRRQPETQRVPPEMVASWIDRESIGDLLRSHDLIGGGDVLSIDIDGMDLWVLEAIEPTARIVVVEYNNRLPAELAITVPYSQTFTVEKSDDRYHGDGYFGASLRAFANLLSPRGYTLVGANRPNTNAFFVRGDHPLPESTVEACLSSRWAQIAQTRWWPAIRDKPWTTMER